MASPKGNGSVGKTARGERFQVPETHDMVTSLFHPLAPKSVFDLCTLACMGVQGFLWLVLPNAVGKYVLLLCFTFWRLSYNLGLGVLLKNQSDSQELVRLYQKHKLRDNKWIQRQLSIKMSDDYDFEAMPDEYNAWLLFRQLVDVILMNDFTSYALFVLAWFNTSTFSMSFYAMLGDLFRWSFGIFLILFNVWVKVDAHRVVKDYAWYWGDFFFLIEQSLTFDGVFEMAPHPMYSVGYFGYYGLSLLSASYMVLFVSIAAHCMQFAFLILVETPHIEKVYNPQKLPKHQPRVNMTLDDDIKLMMVAIEKNAGRDMAPFYFRPDLIVFKNFDIFRSTDLMSLIVIVYSFLLPALVPGDAGKWLAFCQALVWRCIYSLGLGALLHAQSDTMLYTRHFLKWGGTAADAFQHWKSIYNMALSMTYITFIIACCKFYSLPQDWTYGMTLLRHVLGLAFIALHIFTSMSIYDVLGDYGWFYGDFFIDQQRHTLLYTGIYRFLNNPEKIIGSSGFWGMTLITNHWLIYVLALWSQVCNLLFIHHVEDPHMRKLYGEAIRQESGVTKTVRNALTSIPAAVSSMLKPLVTIINGDSHSIERLESAFEGTASSMSSIPKVGSSVLHDLIKETKNHHTEANSNGNIQDCHVHVQKEHYALGQAVVVKWKGAKQAYHESWVGIFKRSEASNPPSGLATTRAEGHWAWINDNQQTDADITHGEVVFRGPQVPWKPGAYECRFHAGSSHKVLATSIPFEISSPIIPSIQDQDALQLFMLKMVQQLMGNDVERMPMSEIDTYHLTDIEAKVLSGLVIDLFKVNFAWQVMQMDTTVTKLTTRIRHAHEILCFSHKQ